MVMAPRGFALAVVICRAAVVTLSAAAFAFIVRAPHVNFTPFIFLQATLILQLFWNAPRLLYDAAQVVVHAPLPPQRMLFSALVVSEWVVMLVLLAAVVVFFQIDTRACVPPPARPGACSHWHGAAAALTLCAWFFSLIVAVLMFGIRTSAAVRQQ